MPIELRLDLSKITRRVPKGLRSGKGAKAADTAMTVADQVLSYTHPEWLPDPVSEKITNPRVFARLRQCTIQARAHVLGIADLPALGYEHAQYLPVTLLRLRVERPGGDVETCLRTSLPPEIRGLAPGYSVRALAHEEDPRTVVIDWKATAEGLGQPLSWVKNLDQYKWPDEDDWPAAGAIEVHDDWFFRRRMEKRRAQWTPVVARLAAGSTRRGRLNDREQWKLDLDVDGRRVRVKERVPDLAIGRLVSGRSEVAAGAPIAALVAPNGDVAVDWQATLNQPELLAAG
jgi:hypothetical protein